MSSSRNLILHIQAQTIAFAHTGFEFSNFAEHYNFFLKYREFCQNNGIFCYFPFAPITQVSGILSRTKTIVKGGEKVMAFLLDYIGCSVIGLAFIRKNNFYQSVNNGRSIYKPFTQKWQDDIFKGLKPKKMIFLHGDNGSKHLEEAQKFFQHYNPIVFTVDEIVSHLMEPIIDKILHLMNEKINPYDIEVTSLAIFDIQLNGMSLIKVTEIDPTPFEKSIVINVDPVKSVSMFCSYPLIKPPELVEEIKLSKFKTKKVKVTLKLDINSFYDFKVEPFYENEKVSKKNNVEEEKKSKESSANLAADNKLVAPNKIRMVFDKQNFSVSYFVDSKEYKVYDSDGKVKTPIYISFTEKKPIIGKAAMEIYDKKPKFVVFDLIRLCSVSTEDICNPKWGFSVSKENDTIMVTMSELEQKTRVAFLLALIIKNGRERIKNEIGKKVEEIEIKFDGISSNEVLKNNFIEAAKLCNVKIVFV
uniref:Uncharacterized protein n=1 Tax=Panagrolaimus sp. PS1159 TaxID=55785 RepID=A0AC35FS12_9BILA